MDKVYFVSNSEEKYKEIQSIMSSNQDCWDISWCKVSLTELQEDDSDVLIRRKALDAYKVLKRPVLVEHTALIIEAFNELPGLHTNYFYSKLGYESIVEYCRFKENFSARVESIICFCDGKRYYIGRGFEKGTIVKSTEDIQAGDAFGWDVIFIPAENNPNHETYAYMGEEKNERSMRKLAVDELLKNCSSNMQAKQETQLPTQAEDLAELARLISEKKVMLFIGAGISASLKFPSWEELIDKIGTNLGYEKDLFKSYGDYMMLAEYADIDDRVEVYDVLKDTFQITDEVKNKLYSSEIYEILEELDFPVIYTTNYDSLIEEYYRHKNREFTVVKDVSDMKKIKQNVPRIMKFHGDLSDKESIVLSESQYFKRMDFQSYMDVQLQADMLQYSILFLGYSLSDINVKLLLYLARKRWSEHEHANEAYIYTATPNCVQKEVFLNKGIVSYSGTQADKEQGTLDFLRRLLQKCNEMKSSEEIVSVP